MAKTHRVTEKTDKNDLEYYRGLVRQLQKKVSSLEKENSRLSKLIRQDEERLLHAIYDEPAKPKKAKKEKKWYCPKCEESEHTEMVLPQGNIHKVYKICKNCGHKDKPKCREYLDASGQQTSD